MKNTERNPIDSNPKSTINKLTDADVESFSRLGIPIGLLQQAGVGRVSNEEAREKFGFNGSGDRAGIVFPYNDPITGVRHTARLRRDHPDIVNGKAKNKYISAWGDHKHLYFVAPGCAELVHDATVPALLVEGEKSALALTAWAARNARKLLPIAMGGCWGWRGRIGKQDGPNGERLDEKGALPELSICSKDREVFVMLDANAATEPQVRAARGALVRELVSYGANVRIATVPALPNINGPDDAIGLLGDSAVQDMLDQARPAEAVAVAEAEAAVEAVCNASTDCKVGETVRAMDAVADVSDDLQREFLVTRLTAATRGSFSKKTITDGITERLRGRKQERAACAQRMEYMAAGPVDGAQVAETIAEFFRQYFVLAPAYFVILAIWTLHTHVFQSFDYTPYLTITSPTKRCAKSNLCAALGVLVARPWKTQSVSVAALARKIEKERCTMLLDEADQAFKGPAEYTSALQGALNSGFEQGGVYSRCVGEGTSMESKDFSTFCPKVIAGIKRLPDTVMDRSIPLRIQRKGKEQVERFRSRMYKPGGAVIKKQVEIWAEGVRTEIGFHQPRVIEELNDRAWDVCEPLMAIAERIGQGWGERLRVALLAVFGSESAEDDDIGIQLLRDIKDVIQEDEVKIPSKDIVARLNALETSPWSDWGHGKGLSANALARMLKGFDIKPRGTRVGDKTPKGYLREEFEAAWRRYLSTPSLSDDFQPQQAVRQLARCTTMTAKRYIRPRPITKRDDPPDILFSD
jgi:Protein of unknown function (DUF3631)/Domain of unknown function (DUF3854)